MKRKRWVRRPLALLLTVAMCVSVFSVAALAEEPVQQEKEALGSVPETEAGETAVEETPKAPAAETPVMTVKEEAVKSDVPDDAVGESGQEKAVEKATLSEEAALKEEEKAQAVPEEKEKEKTEEEETEQEKEEEKEEEAGAEALTEQTITAVVLGGGDTEILLSGQMPQGAVVKAKPVQVDIDGIEVLAAYDITIFDAEGGIYQPQDGSIRVQIRNGAIREAMKEQRDLTAYHMEDTGAAPEPVAVTKGRNGAAVFSARHFSIYVVGEDDKLYEQDGETRHCVYEVKFYADSNGDGKADLLSTQTLSPGEHVEEPGVPEREHYLFQGWQVKESGEMFDFSDNNTLPPIEGDADVELNLYACYTQVYYVHFMTKPHTEGDENTKVVFHTGAYTQGDPLDIANVNDLFLKEGYLSYVDNEGHTITTKAVERWVDAGGNPAPETVTEDLELYPVIVDAVWIYFDMNGKNTSLPPEYIVAADHKVGELPEAACAGYTFEGWYTASQGGTKVTSETFLDDLPRNVDGSITLYADWSVANVGYTVNLWRQKATDGQLGLDQKEYRDGEAYEEYSTYYDFAQSYHVDEKTSTLKTGDQPGVSVLSAYTGFGTTTNDGSAYFGFEYAEKRTQGDLARITMAPDGSTVLNVYYDRVTVVWNFYNTTTAGDQPSAYDYYGTLTGLFDTNITPKNGSEAPGTWDTWTEKEGYRWGYTVGSGWGSSYRLTEFQTVYRLIDRNSSSLNRVRVNWFLVRNSGGYSAKYYYYLEMTNEAAADADAAKAQEAASLGISYKQKVNGKTYVYERTYKMQFTTTMTLYLDEKYAGYTIAGYGKSASAFNKAAEGTTTSVANKDTIYIYNDALSYTITLISSDKNIGVADNGSLFDAGDKATYTFKYGEDLTGLTFPGTGLLDGALFGPAAYYEFDGTWMEDPQFTTAFVKPDTMPANNLAAYADWKLKTITVTFEPGTAVVEAPEAQEILAAGTVEDPGVLEREGYTHVGWIDQNGKVFNFSTVLYEDMTLFAIWKADDEQGHCLTYDLNTGSAPQLFDGYTGDTSFQDGEHFAEGDYHDLWAIEHVFPELNEKQYDAFIGWNTMADGSGALYYPDDEILVTEDQILYAVWAHENLSTLVLDHNYPNGYQSEPGDKGTEIITRNNLTDIDLTKESGLAYHQEIQVIGGDGITHAYRFEGWSTKQTSAASATDEDVEFSATDHVAVDTMADKSGNTLYAVWLEVGNLTVTKEVVNPAVNGTDLSEAAFDFTWTVESGDGNQTTGEVTGITDGDSFEIPDVAAGETVTIRETEKTGYTAAYTTTGSDAQMEDDGSFSFTASAAYADEVTVTNTVDTKKLTVRKVWKDKDGSEETGIIHEGVTVEVFDGEELIEELLLDESCEWSADLTVLADEDRVYSVKEMAVPGYKRAVNEDTDAEGNTVFTVTNTNVHTHFNSDGTLRVTKFWEDQKDSLGLRPASVTVQLLADGEEVEGATLVLNRQNGWSNCFTDLEEFVGGKKIEYSVAEVDLTEDYQLDRIEKIWNEADYNLVVVNRLISEEKPGENPEEPGETPGEPPEEKEDIPEGGDITPDGGGDMDDAGNEDAARDDAGNDLKTPEVSLVVDGPSTDADASTGQEETLFYQVKTGDPGTAPLFFLLLLVSGTTIVMVVRRYRRRTTNR